MRDDRLNPLEDGRLPDWVSAWGEDGCGAWVAFEIEGVSQVMRWTPPGAFLMGSPEDEPGRYDNEGPQHQVTFRRGFWLAETPCSQALWTAVMGSNPGTFVDPHRPVENVSFDDVERFLAECERRRPGLALRVPTETEWEYACRGGRTTATYAGPIEILGECNAPVLDAIAWYAGNSGVEYDLDEGYNSAPWPKKQYPHELMGTRKIKSRRRNPWGLYDTLGNVLEWCADGTSGLGAPPPYSPEPQVAAGPVGEERPDRVVRGGAWSNYARSVRAAYRGAARREARDDSLGFRFARGRG